MYDTYHYEDDESGLSFDMEWTAPGVSSTNEARHENLVEAAAEKAAEYAQAALDIGEHWELDHVKLTLDNWSKPMCRVWLRGPAGYLTPEHDDPEAAEKVAQRKEFYRGHNAVHDERINHRSNFYDIQIDVRQF